MLKLYLKTFEVKNAHETLKLPKEKAKSNCPSGVFTNYRTSHPEVVEWLLWKIRENSVKSNGGGVFFRF